MKMKRCAVICYVLLIAMLLSFSSMALIPANDEWFEAPEYVEKYIDPDEESHLTLSYDFELGTVLNIKITDERTGKVWETNPIFTSGDIGSNEDRVQLLKSQIVIKYAYDDEASGGAGYLADVSTITTAYSFTDSVEQDQLDIFETYDDDGNLVKLRIEYGIGDVEESPIPKVLTAERMEYWLEQCVKRDEDGNVIYKTDADGNVVYKTDDSGNVLVDEDGNPVPLPVYDTNLQRTLENYYEPISIELKQEEYERARRRVKDERELQTLITNQEKDLENYIASYPGLSMQDGTQVLYKLYSSVTMNIRYTREAIANWAAAGYNKDELEIDYALAQHTEVSNDFAFIIPVEYEIQGNDLVATIITDEIIYPNSVVISELWLLPSLGAGDDTSEVGYTFIPDGSGAIVEHNRTESRISSTIVTLLDYSKDEANSSGLVSDLPYLETSVLPIFGQKYDNDAFVAVIEKGFELAAVYASSSDAFSKYHLSYPIFYPTFRDSISYSTASLTPGSKLNGVVRYPQVNTIEVGEYRDDATLRMMSYVGVWTYARLPDTELSVRYSFLSGDDASYAGMAEYYRDYLIDTYGLEKVEAGDGIPLYADIYGAIDKTVSYVGFPFTVKYPLTTFDQAAEIVDAIQALDITNINLRYLYMINGGAVSTAANQFNVLGKLGGEKGFETFLDQMAAEGVSVYPEVDLIHVYRDKLFDGFSPNDDTVQTLGKTATIIYDKNLATGLNPTGDYEAFHPRWAISTAYYEEYAEKLFADYEQYGNYNISLGSYGNTLNSDYNEELVIDRTQSSRVMVELLKKYKEQGYSIIVEKGYCHTLPYVDTVLDIAMGSSQLVFTDYEVPFLQIVLHGLVEYCGAPINVDQGYTKNVLKCLEYGSGIYVRFMYEEDGVFQNTNFQNLYSMNYRNWLDTVGEMYSEVNAVLDAVQDQFIVDHERLAYNVYRTTYENGLQVIVNYNLEDYVDAASGITVAAEGYVVIGGEQ